MVQKVIIVSVRVLCVSIQRLKSFPVGGGWVGWLVHKVIKVSVCVLYGRFQVFGFSGFWVFRFFGRDGTPGFSDRTGRQVFRTGRDAELDNLAETPQFPNFLGFFEGFP